MPSSTISEAVPACSPLTASCIKFLTDKLEEKRKMAASEIEKMTFEFSSTSNHLMVDRLIAVLGRNFCLSTNPNTRKGGLIGLAAVMIGFKNGSNEEPPDNVVEEVVRPILTCFLDPDPLVRYFACESLFNVTKVAKAKIFPLFESIFDCMAKIVADRDQNVKIASESLDRLLKDIVAEQQHLQIDSFVPKLQDYIYTKNPFTRLFIISWIRLLDSKIDIINHLPVLLDGIFNCLYDSTEEIRAATLGLLSEVLNKIVVRPSDKIDLPELIRILLKHAKNSSEDNAQYTAISWIKQLIGLMDDKGLIEFSPGILSAILPCLAIQSSPDGSMISPAQSSTIHRYMSPSPSRNSICEISQIVNSTLLDQVTTVFEDRRKTLRAESRNTELDPILEVLIDQIQTQEHPVIKSAVLEWLKRLKKVEPDLTLLSASQSKLFLILLDTLSAQSDTVVKNALRVMADWYCFDGTGDEQQVAASDQEDMGGASAKEDETTDLDRRKSTLRTQSSVQKGSSLVPKKVAIAPSEQTQKSTAGVNRFIQALYQLFHDRDLVFEERGTFIILNLCSMVKPDIIYKSFAEIITDNKTDSKFSCNLVQKLNHILITTQPLSGLRLRMGNDDDPEMVSLFHSLYYAWCHSPISVLTLCLLTNNFRQANGIVMAISQTDVNMELLTQIDWVVQLIESPVFSPLRMKLLDLNVNQYLLQSLYGLLMVLPQSEAYKRLSHRLDQAYKFMSIQSHFKSQSGLSATGRPAQPATKETVSKKTGSPATSYESLMKHYLQIQNQRGKHIRLSERDE